MKYSISFSFTIMNWMTSIPLSGKGHHCVKTHRILLEAEKKSQIDKAILLRKKNAAGTPIPNARAMVTKTT